MIVTASTSTHEGSNSVPSAQEVVGGDFETFLRMLTTQIQNQDPLSPLESEEFASQLATFSMVEQQTLTNQKLEQLMSRQNAGGLASYASVIGREASHAGPFAYSGQAVDLSFWPNDLPAGAKMVILDSDQQVVFEQSVGKGTFSTQWQGQRTDGASAPPGNYTSEVRMVADDKLVEIPVVTSGEVEEIRFEPDGPILVLADGSEVVESAVTSLR
jgi:flagellar basal-body rod modification protein FlgD